MIVDFESFSVTLSTAVFVAGAIAIFLAGTQLSKWADDFSEHTGIGRAFIGVLLLGGITSLPEFATTVTASLAGNAGMAVSNILGGISMQVAILAVVDFWVRQKPVSAATSNIVILLEGGLLIVMLALTGIFILLPEISFAHIGLTSILLLLIFLLSLFIIHKFNSYKWLSYQSSDANIISGTIEHLQKTQAHLDKDESDGEQMPQKVTPWHYISKKGGWLFLYSAVILAGGYIVVKSSENIADKTGFSTSFAGLVLVAVTTSLPEISTTIGAVRLKRFDMAFSNIFGTNLFDVALIFVADVLYLKGTVLGALSNFAVVAAYHGIILTAIFLTGLAARSKKVFWGLGYDSLLIIAAYLSGIFLLYTMEG